MTDLTEQDELTEIAQRLAQTLGDITRHEMPNGVWSVGEETDAEVDRIRCRLDELEELVRRERRELRELVLRRMVRRVWHHAFCHQAVDGHEEGAGDPDQLNVYGVASALADAQDQAHEGWGQAISETSEVELLRDQVLARIVETEGTDSSPVARELRAHAVVQEFLDAIEEEETDR